ncbi:hypothetical protein [Chimaeribacter arupi]|uniref:hypothetical protein n=1 Tax=Chimaeribacter arupi TaxID=2060066 RepID=UPI000C796C0F|nr:hypothetical protein [Chimaeribacter arupi]PLR52416.1 hypothetical protein CYR52_07615 [Chimaeribacter arupi]
MFKLSDFFNVKRELAEGSAAAGGESAPAPATEAAPAAAQAEQTTSLLGGNQQQPTEAAPEPFLAALPEEGDADGWNALYAKLGRPESAEGYELPLPEGDAGEFAKTTAEWMHQAGLNKQQAQALATQWNAHQAQQAEAQQAALQKQVETDLSTIKQEWGAQFDENKALMSKAVSTFAPPEFIEMLDKSGLINSPVIAKMFLKIGAAINEDKSVATPKTPPQGGEMTLAQRLWPSMN